jgi:uncharacterized protein YegL
MNSLERLEAMNKTIHTMKRCLHRDMKRETLAELDILSGQLEAALCDQENFIMEKIHEY